MPSSLEKAQTAEKAVLAAQVSKHLKMLVQQGTVPGSSRPILDQGAELLSSLLRGALFVEAPEEAHGAAPSLVALPEYSQARTALSAVELKAETGDYAEVLATLKTHLSAILEGGEFNEEEINQLHSFFLALAKLLYKELEAREYVRNSSSNYFSPGYLPSGAFA